MFHLVSLSLQISLADLPGPCLGLCVGVACCWVVLLLVSFFFFLLAAAWVDPGRNALQSAEQRC